MRRVEALALLTQHGKAQALTGLAERLGLPLLHTDAYDTDQLGTFTGDVPRRGPPIEAALAKARLATELTGARYGLGSEGSFGPDPGVGCTAWGLEIVVWFDRATGRHVHAAAQGPQTNYRQQEALRLDEVLSFAEAVGFPSHGVIVGRPGQAWFDKFVADLDTLRQRAAQGLAHGAVWLETDMRAHRNPTRMAMIRAAADALAERLSRRCPRCAAPGFGPSRLLPGARCETCGHLTSAARARLLCCDACAHQEEEPLRASVPALRCDRCNP